MDMKELLALRRRAFGLFTRSESTGGWTLSSSDAAQFVDCYRPLRLRPGYELGVYELSFGSDGSRGLYALPHGAPREPPPPQTENPRLAAALDHFMEAIQGDGTPWSYLLASFLSRDGENVGAWSHGYGWRTCSLLLESPFWESSRIQAAAEQVFEIVQSRGIDGITFFAKHLPDGHKIIAKQRRKERQGKTYAVTARDLFNRITWTSHTLHRVLSGLGYPLPPDLEARKGHFTLPTSEPDWWEWREPLPTTWQPEVRMGDRVEVVFYTYRGLHRERIVRHRDLFDPGSYCPTRNHEEIGSRPSGYIT
jgi:hypothetical protein